MPNQIRCNVLLACILASNSAFAEEHVATVDWSKLKSDGQLKTGEVVSASDGAIDSEELLIENRSGKPMTAPLLTLDPVDFSKHFYTLRGRIRYEGVTDAGYLEMWSEFKDGRRCFTRSLGSLGPMARIEGDSESREFICPFESTAKSGLPVKIDLNLVLPGNGKVWISPLKLTEFSKNEWPSAMTPEGAWWSSQTAGWLGGIFGPFLGILGAIVGVLTSRGRGRNVCLGICWFVVVLGIACLIAGLVALPQSQPYEVYFPLLLLGTISTGVMGGMIPQTRKRFEDQELRRMEAMDAGLAS